MRKLFTDSNLIFRRSLRHGRRQVATVFVAPAILAVLVVVMIDSLYGDVAATDRFPGGFLEWVAPAAVLLSVLLGAGLTAASVITDLRGGYVDRLRLVSTSPAAMILGRAAADAVRAVPTAVAVFGVCMLLGASNAGGIGGLLGLLALVVALAVSWNGIFYAAAAITVNPASIQGLQPVTFMPAVMFSSFWVPDALMPGWYRWIANHNPITPVIDAARSMMLGATDWSQLAIALIVLTVLAVATYPLAGLRLARLLRSA